MIITTYLNKINFVTFLSTPGILRNAKGNQQDQRARKGSADVLRLEFVEKEKLSKFKGFEKWAERSKLKF